jgi:hypothetical protein
MSDDEAPEWIYLDTREIVGVMIGKDYIVVTKTGRVPGYDMGEIEVIPRAQNAEGHADA